MSRPLYIVLCSAEHEKIQMAAMMASVAAVSDRATTVLVSMGALAAFRRDLSGDMRYRGGAFSREMVARGVPDAIDLFRQGRELGGLRLYACSMALGVDGLALDDLVEGLFDDAMGLAGFLADAEGGDLVTL